MKENWKLIELLDEYDSWFEHRAYNWKIQRRIKQSKNKRFPVWWNSKSFWFIGWLLREEKIDLLKLNFAFRYTDIIVGYFSWEDRIIMILSVEENPIDFLIGVLK